MANPYNQSNAVATAGSQTYSKADVKAGKINPYDDWGAQNKDKANADNENAKVTSIKASQPTKQPAQKQIPQPKPQPQNWFQKGISGVVQAFTPKAVGKVASDSGNLLKSTFVDPVANVVQQARISGQVQSKNNGAPVVGDNFAKNQNAEIDRALKAGEINQQKANDLRAKTSKAVATTKKSIQGAEKNVGVKYDPSAGVQGLIDTATNFTGTGELGTVGKTLFTKAAEAASKRLGRKLTVDEATNLVAQTKKVVPEQLHASEAGSIPAPTVPKVEPISAPVKTAEPPVVTAPVTAPHPMQEPIFNAAKTQAETRLGRSLTPVETTKLTNDTQKLIAEKMPLPEPQAPVVASEKAPITEPIPKEVPLTEPKVPAGDTVSGNSARIHQNSLEKHLTDNYGDLATYKGADMKDQAKQAIDLVKNDRQKAIDIIDGKANPPGDLRALSVHQELEKVATLEGNGELLNKLAASHVNSELSTGASNMRIAAERDPHSPVEQIRQIQEARVKASERRTGTTVAKETVKATQAVAKATRITTKEDLHSFIQGLSC